MLDLYVITRRPSDFPEHICLRRQTASLFGVTMAPVCGVYSDLAEARQDVPFGLFCMPRQPDDDPVIVEVWF
jgi:hypothetical protein